MYDHSTVDALWRSLDWLPRAEWEDALGSYLGRRWARLDLSEAIDRIVARGELPCMVDGNAVGTVHPRLPRGRSEFHLVDLIGSFSARPSGTWCRRTDLLDRAEHVLDLAYLWNEVDKLQASAARSVVTAFKADLISASHVGVLMARIYPTRESANADTLLSIVEALPSIGSRAAAEEWLTGICA